MESYWDRARRLEGTTLPTASKRKEFLIVEVNDEGLKIEIGTRGTEYPYSRDRIERGCRACEDAGQFTVEVLRNAGVTNRQSSMSYLLPLIEAILMKDCPASWRT
jgi:hypothetical protein